MTIVAEDHWGEKAADVNADTLEFVLELHTEGVRAGGQRPEFEVTSAPWRIGRPTMTDEEEMPRTESTLDRILRLSTSGDTD